MLAARNALVLATAIAAAGCSETEAIRTGEEPAAAAATRKPIPDDQKQYRTLAAMVPVGGIAAEDQEPHWWFLKMSGKAGAIARHEADFDAIVNTVRTEPGEGEPIVWTLPKGWTREKGGTGMMSRYATLKSPDGQTEVAVSRAGGLVFSNVQRWWTQLWGKDRSDDVTASNISEFSRLRTVNGRLIVTADMSGPKDPNMRDPGMGGHMMNPHGGN